MTPMIITVLIWRIIYKQNIMLCGIVQLLKNLKLQNSHQNWLLLFIMVFGNIQIILVKNPTSSSNVEHLHSTIKSFVWPSSSKFKSIIERCEPKMVPTCGD